MPEELQLLKDLQTGENPVATRAAAHLLLQAAICTVLNSFLEVCYQKCLLSTDALCKAYSGVDHAKLKSLCTDYTNAVVVAKELGTSMEAVYLDTLGKASFGYPELTLAMAEELAHFLNDTIRQKAVVDKGLSAAKDNARATVSGLQTLHSK